MRDIRREETDQFTVTGRLELHIYILTLYNSGEQKKCLRTQNVPYVEADTLQQQATTGFPSISQE